jgi:glycosyltransferase involved in cell wall biosynthesis
LATGLAQRGHEVLAVTLGQGGPLASSIVGARLLPLNKRTRLDNLRVLFALASLLRQNRPQVHYTFLSAPAVLGGLLRPLFPATRLVVGVRATQVDFSHYGHGRAGRIMDRLEARVASRADAVIANSQAGRNDCLKRGIPAQRCHAVPNGIDTDRCRTDRALGSPLRAEWGVTAGQPLVGLVARLDPMKDHPTFLEAAARIATANPQARFVCVGGGPEAYSAQLRQQAEALGLAERLTWTGTRTDMPAVYNALDVLCLASAFGEGFPNVLGEAMASGVPCVTTDVGDAALVVGDTGVVVPKGDPKALAQGILDQLQRLEREQDALRDACRQRIVTEFSVERMVLATEALLQGLCQEPR